MRFAATVFTSALQISLCAFECCKLGMTVERLAPTWMTPRSTSGPRAEPMSLWKFQKHQVGECQPGERLTPRSAAGYPQHGFPSPGCGVQQNPIEHGQDDSAKAILAKVILASGNLDDAEVDASRSRCGSFRVPTFISQTVFLKSCGKSRFPNKFSIHK